MVDYLERMAKARFMAVQPTVEPGVLLAALGPKMLELSATQANGAHPYFTTPEHTAIARETMGDDALLRQNKWWCYQQIPMKLAALLGQV